MSFNHEYGGEPYDYEDTPNYWTQRDMELMIMQEEQERRERYGD